jgi:ParB-like nuclease domain
MNRKNQAQTGLRPPQQRSPRSLDLSIIYSRIDELKPDPANPRRHSTKQVRQIANSIDTFGFNVPVLRDRDGNVIAGHGRLLAAKELGWNEVPTLCLDHLSRAQARAFMIADNRLTEIATWDERLLAQQLKDLSLLGLDFSLELTGFEMPEIDLRIASLDDPPEAGDDPADAVPEIPSSPPISKTGGSMGPRAPSPAVRHGPRCRGFRCADGRGTRRDGVHRPAVQRADRRSRERPRRDPSSPLPDGLRRDE